MTSTILRNPYAAILQAIWSIIKDVAQSTANTLGIRRLTFVNPKSQHENNITPDSGAANPLGLLPYPSKNWGCGVSREFTKVLRSVYGYSSHIDNGSGEPLCGKFKNKRWKSDVGIPTCMFCERAVINAPIIAAYREKFARKPKKGQVYLISAIGLNRYKIGATTDFYKRLPALQSFSPVTLEVLSVFECSDIEKAEAWLHKKFASCRRHSEWFDLSNSDVQWIMSLASLEEVTSEPS